MMILEKLQLQTRPWWVVLIYNLNPWRSGRGEFVLNETGKTRFEIISSWVSWMVHITIQTQGITPRSVIDKIDGNRCQRRLDQSGQTIRYQKQLEVTFETVDLHEGRRLFCGCAIKALIYGEGTIENFHSFFLKEKLQRF